jgi:hypothetical protein
VAGVQWEMMEAGKLGEQLNPWGSQLFQTLRTVDPKTTAEQSAFDAWLSQTSDRETARNDRIHGAVGVIPTPLWIVLFFISGLIFVYMLFFADKGERAVVQALLIGHGGSGHHGHAAVVVRAGQSIPQRNRRSPSGCDAADSTDHRRGARDRG